MMLKIFGFSLLWFSAVIKINPQNLFAHAVVFIGVSLATLALLVLLRKSGLVTRAFKKSPPMVDEEPVLYGVNKNFDGTFLRQ
ncbi:MAG: hypothetical protein EOO52_13520 [Gammaproteobacteria bacterium]|nr:MAG: hypothetical protein EOO52_13520 [Gammaproteobacteria bacterium]